MPKVFYVIRERTDSQLSVGNTSKQRDQLVCATPLVTSLNGGKPFRVFVSQLLYLNSNPTPSTLLKSFVKNYQWLGQESPKLPEQSRMGQQPLMGRTWELPPQVLFSSAATHDPKYRKAQLSIWTRLSRSCALPVPPKPMLTKGKG